MTRALMSALAVMAALGSGGSAGAASWGLPQPDEISIGGDPWAAAIDGSAAFGADDAFVFADIAASSRLDDDAVAVAVRIDQTRLASSFAPHADPDGRVGAAFGRFVALGPDGLAYASLGLMRGDASPARLARAPTPSLVAMVLPDR